jgi:UDP-3-O-[3-hydroxymyristoyl] glucosamine N-acyltransferase
MPLLKELAKAIGARVVGEGDAEICGIASLQSATAKDLVFVEDVKHLSSALASAAAAVIAGEFAAEARSSKPILIAAQPRLAFARAARLLSSHANSGRSKPPAPAATAIVHPTVRLGTSVRVGERVVIGEEATIGNGTTVGAGCVIGAHVSIGEDCRIYPNVTIYDGTRLGDRVVVHAGAVLGSDGFGYVRDAVSGRYEPFPQIGRLVIEDDVEIGANATVDRGALEETRIRRGTKIDNLVHLGHNVQIGEDVVIAAQTGLSGSVVVEDGVIIGGQVGIGDHVRIKEGAILGSQCGVLPNKVVRGNGVIFWGTPARPLRQYLKELAVLARIAHKR